MNIYGSRKTRLLYITVKSSELHNRVHDTSQVEPSQSSVEPDKIKRTLMDVVTAEIYFPRLSKPEHETNFKDFLQGKSTTDYLLNSSHATGKSILHDILILQFKVISSKCL